jgi:hypothetical protein
MTNLRSHTIRLAASLEAADPTRMLLLAVLDRTARPPREKGSDGDSWKHWLLTEDLATHARVQARKWAAKAAKTPEFQHLNPRDLHEVPQARKVQNDKIVYRFQGKGHSHIVYVTYPLSDVQWEIDAD